MLLSHSHLVCAICTSYWSFFNMFHGKLIIDWMSDFNLIKFIQVSNLRCHLLQSEYTNGSLIKHFVSMIKHELAELRVYGQYRKSWWIPSWSGRENKSLVFLNLSVIGFQVEINWQKRQYSNSVRSPLWRRGGVSVSHAVVPGSIFGRVAIFTLFLKLELEEMVEKNLNR